MKITSRSLILWNIILFSILSIGLFHISGSNLNNVSAFSRQFFVATKEVYFTIFVLVGLTFTSIFFVLKISKFFFAVTILSIAVLTSIQLTENFSKLILVILFLYLIVAYYYYQFLGLEINGACYKPNFSKYNLFNPMLYKIKCDIYNGDEKIADSYLTNWDENSCFIRMQGPLDLPPEFIVKIEVGDEQFQDQAKLVSKISGGNGYGLKFKQRTIGKQSWNDFIFFTADMGLLPEIVR